jgi:uncharacterized membrane protein
MRSEHTVTIDAPPDAVWAVLMDVESWPQITASMDEVRKLDDGPLQIGSRARIRQPKLPPAVWTVTELAPPARFTWVATGPGVRTTALHEVTGTGGTSQLRLELTQAGPLGSALGRLARGLVARYLSLEADGIKRRAEGRS